MKKCPKCGAEYDDASTLCPNDGEALALQDDLVGRVLADKYRIEERISEGGMGAVYRATHVLMDKTVAIKVLRPSLAVDEKLVARFTREARAASRLGHPHAITVMDFGEDSGLVFLVMEYLRGRTLKDLIREEGPLPIDRVVEISRQIADALDAAHAQGVVHRDLKSDNIMLVEINGGRDWVKVVDFGIAKIMEPTDPELTAPNLVIGTPHYMSPEQCSRSTVDARSDVYSLGVIIYEMLTGHVPFTADSPTEVLLKHLREQPPSVREERPALPLAVDRVVMRALAKRPEERFQTAGELASALALAATGVEQTATFAERPRIVVPVGEEREEATVVQSAVAAPPVATGPAPSRPKPWQMLVPGLVLLVVVFGIFYALHRGGSGTDKEQPPVVTEPGVQPVRPAKPATGESERDVAARDRTHHDNANQQVTENANRASGTESMPLPTTAGTTVEPMLPPDAEPRLIEEAATGNRNANRNEMRAEPTPRPTNNANQKREATPAKQQLPRTTPSEVPVEPPAPKKEPPVIP